MLLSFVFSFRNEEDNIPELVRRVSVAVQTIPGATCEMIFVNDASTDRSLEVLRDLQKEYPITVVNMSRRFGVIPCALAGLSYARGDAAIYMDADLQDPPEIVPEMVQKFCDGADVVHTVRTRREGEGLLKMWITKKAYQAINLVNHFTDVHLPENAGDFKLLSRRAVQELLKIGEVDPYMRGLSVWVGFTQNYVLYRREPRFSGKSQFPLISRGPIREFIRGITSFSAAPLYLSLLLGIITGLGALGLILYATVTKFLGVSAPGASGVLIAIAFFSGIILISNGIIGLYIARIFYEVKGRPRYIIESVIKPDAAKT